MTPPTIPTVEGDLLWTPSPSRAANSQTAQFIRWVKQRLDFDFANYSQLWQWSVSDDAFWSAIWDYCEVISDSKYDRVCSGETMFRSRWFEGSRVNYAEHLLRHEIVAGADEIAFYHSSEIRPLAGLTWCELGAKVRALATSLRALGVGPGDRIASYLPNVYETAVAMMATSAVGAIWSAASPEFGSKTVVDRFAQIAPKFLLATDGYSFGGKRFDRRQEVEAIAAGLPSLKGIIWLRYLGLEIPQTEQPCLLLEDMLSQPAPAREAFSFERVPFDHPLWVLFTSGTTGLPKAIVHSHVGIVVDHLKTMRVQLDLHPGMCMFFYSTTGWMMWNAVVSALIAGASAVLYDGSPTYPSMDKLWSIAEATGTTHFGASPTLVQIMEKGGVTPGKSQNLNRLKAILLGGAPSTPQTFKWFYENVKPDLWVFSTSGGTELCGSLVGAVSTEPVYAGEIQGRALGIDVHAWNEDGKEIVDQVGELVITSAFPSMPLRFWGDEGDERYFETYFKEFPGVWRHGDFIKINARGGCFIYGRSDATLNRYGVRIGTAEIYREVEQIAGVQDSLVVCCETGNGGFFMPLFVWLKTGVYLTEELTELINERLKIRASPRHVPDVTISAPGIAYTLTGKKMEVPVRKILMGVPLEKAVSLDATANPDIVRWFVEFAKLPETRRKIAGERA